VHGYAIIEMPKVLPLTLRAYKEKIPSFILAYFYSERVFAVLAPMTVSSV
jgi:hypothetical protein